MDILGKFLSENLPDHGKKDTTEPKQCVTSTASTGLVKSDKSKCGKLVVTGCMDWQSKLSSLETSKVVLDEPHEFPLPFRVKRVFTSASSVHTFLISEEDELYSFGKDEWYCCSLLHLFELSFSSSNTLTFRQFRIERLRSAGTG